MDNKDKLISSLSKDTLIASSYSDWLRARTKSIDDNLQLISDFINDDDELTTVSSFLYDKAVSADRSLILGDYVGTIGDFLTKLANNDFDEDAVISSLYTDQAPYIGDVIDESVVLRELRDAIVVAGDALKLAAENEGRDVADVYAQLITARSSDGSYFNPSINTALLTVLSNNGLSIREKIAAINDCMFGNTAELNSEDIDLSFNNVPMKQLTGVNPVSCVIENLVLPDLSSLMTILITVATLFKSVRQTIGGLVDKTAKKVGVYFDQLTNNPPDFDRYDTPGDGTIDNIIYQMRIPASYLTPTTGGFLRKISDKHYIHLSTTFCELYVFGTFDIHEELALVNVKVLWKPLSMDKFLASVVSVVNTTSSLGSDIHKAFALFNNDSYFMPTNEEDIYEGIVSAKQLLLLYVILLEGIDDSTPNALILLLLALWDTQKDLVRVFPQGGTITNTRVCREIIGSSITSAIAEANDGVYIYDADDEDPLSASVLGLIQYYENYANSGIYVPYALCNSIDKGSIFVKDDDQNSELYKKFLKFSGIAITVAATIGSVSIIKRKLKLATVSASRKARLALKAYDTSGTTADKYKAFKAVKKYNLATKLSGGFAVGAASMPALMSKFAVDNSTFSNVISDSFNGIGEVKGSVASLKDEMSISLKDINEIKDLLV